VGGTLREIYFSLVSKIDAFRKGLQHEMLTSELEKKRIASYPKAITSPGVAKWVQLFRCSEVFGEFSKEEWISE